MRGRAQVAVLAFALGPVLPGLAFGQAGTPPGGERTARPPVRVGPTTVTVIDANESIDDVISRVREARRPDRTRSDKGGGTADKDRDRGEARDASDRARLDKTAGKLDKPNRLTERERIRKLRENFKERRQQREGRDGRDLQRKTER